MKLPKIPDALMLPLMILLPGGIAIGAAYYALRLRAREAQVQKQPPKPPSAKLGA